MSIEIKLNRVDKRYRPGDIVSGVLLFHNSSSINYNGLYLYAVGSISPNLKQNRDQISTEFDSNPPRPIELMNIEVDLEAGAKNSSGTLPPNVQIPFEFELVPLPGRSLYDSYHGVYVSVSYHLSVVLFKSGILSTTRVEERCDLNVEVPVTKLLDPRSMSFDIDPNILQNVKKASIGAIPPFRANVVLHKTICSINSAFTGEISVLESSSSIKSIDVQLIRVESIGRNENALRMATEIQNIQIAQGPDICKMISIPIFFLFPRSFSCPSISTPDYRVEFEVNVTFSFAEAYMITQNVPVILYRS